MTRKTALLDYLLMFLMFRIKDLPSSSSVIIKNLQNFAKAKSSWEALSVI